METIEGIVLGTWPYRETTLIVRLLTREHGVVSGLARGARRTTGRSASQAAFEPLARVSAQVKLKEGDQLCPLGEVRPLAGWDYLRRDFTRLAWAGLAVELLGAIATHAPPEAFYFDDACQFLEQLETTPATGSLTIALMLRHLHLAGFPPRLGFDPASGEEWPAYLCWHFDEGMWLPATAADPRGAMRLPGTAVAELSPWLTRPPELDGSFQIPGRQGPPLVRWLVRVWEDHLHHPLKAAQYLEKMVLK